MGYADQSAGDLSAPARPSARPAAATLDADALERCRSLLQGVLSCTDAVVYAKDLDGYFTLTNAALDRVLGVPVGTVVGRTDYDLMPAEAADELRRHDQEVACTGQREVQTERKQHRDGTWHDYLSARFPLLDTEGRICAVGGMMIDVTELADQRRELVEAARRQSALLAELEALAVTDPLTLLPNRRGWEQRLTTVLAMAERNRLPLTVGIADLDHFKRFNDTYGHPAGDVLLRQFADAASGAIRAGDAIARWGGEEFAIALPDCDAEAAFAVLERIRRALPSPETCSIGYATWDGSETGEDLVARADRALYEAKGAGRDRICGASAT